MTATAAPRLWILDSPREPLRESALLLEEFAECRYFAHGEAVEAPEPPDLIVVSADLPGGAAGEAFARLVAEAGRVPVLVASALRSLTQALDFLRRGAADYLPLPLEPEEWRERLEAALALAETFTLGDISGSLDGAPGDDEDADDEDVAEVAVEAEPAAPAHDEPEAVDGVAIPVMWDELPCGLTAFDSNRNLVFCNQLALDLFGIGSLAELQDALDAGLAGFQALAANGHPLPDNQWPHLLAFKSRTPRSGVVSVERRDRSRVWLRFDCLPHLSDRAVSRLTMTMVNVTGEVPPPRPASPSAAPAKRSRAKRRK